MERRLASLNDREHVALVAARGEMIVGFIGARLDRSFEDGLQVRILALVVDENHRGAGIGRAMVKDVEAWALLCGASKIAVNTSHLRLTQTHECYRSVGYESTGLRFVKQLT